MKKVIKKLIPLFLAVLLCTVTVLGQFSVLAADVTETAGETSYCGYRSLYQVEINQTKLNYTDISVKVKNARSILSAGYADSVKITAQMFCEEKVVKSTSETFALSNLKTKAASMKMPTFGKFIVYAEYLKGENVVHKTDEAVVGIAATEYNICPVNASFPVVYLTLGLWDITKTADGEPIPTFVMLNRTAQYNWDALPENVYGQPNLTDAELRKMGGFETKSEKMIEFIADLVEISPEGTKYNLYINDAFVKYILRMLDANGIDESNYTVKLLSDGSGSYANFNKAYNVENATEKYETMCKQWKAAKDYTKENGGIGSLTEFMPDYSSSTYAYVAASTSGGNVEWWVARTNGTLNIPNDQSNFLATVTSNPQVVVKNMNTMLTGIQEKGEKAVSEFKALFNFNGEMFEDAEIQNKPVMLFVGSRCTSEDAFEEFAKFVVAYYGDNYVYYYKGHPATPTALYPEKQAQLDKLGITDVESSIPAELIFFFYPEIYAAGYSSTTFQSVNPDKTLCYFNVASSTESPEYLKNANCYMNHIKASSADNIKELCDSEKLEAGNYFLCEIKDNSEYDIAIWDAASSLISFYKLNAETGKYDFVSSRDAMDDQTIEIENPSINVVLGKTAAINASAKTALTYESSDPEIATVAADGTITAKGYGTATITVKASSSIFYKATEAQVTVTVTPDVVSSVKATSDSFTSIKLSWAKLEGVTGYQVYRSDSADGEYTLVYQVTGARFNSFTDTDLTTGKEYYYKVCARKAVNGKYVYGDFCDVITATTNITPKKVSSVKAASASLSSVKLSWAKLEGVTGYQVYRSDSADGEYTLVYQVKGARYISFTDKDLKTGKKYYYKVRARKYVDGKYVYGEFSSVASAAASVQKVTLSSVSNESGQKAKLTWKKQAGVTGYAVYRADKTGKFTRIKTITGANNVTYTNSYLTGKTKLAKNQTYTYKVRAFVTVDGTNVYGPYSDVKSVTIKK
ncbi:MAG: fibronectin type III domain-containing protein [Acutalibacteraceae bacterium]